MRGSKAKEIRRQVYGDQSLRQKRDYRIIRRKKSTYSPESGQIVNAIGSLRALYQKAKKAYTTAAT